MEDFVKSVKRTHNKKLDRTSMAKFVRLKATENAILYVAKFLKNVLPFANEHNCDIITENLWEKCLPVDLRLEIDNFTDDDLLKLLEKQLHCEDEKEEIKSRLAQKWDVDDFMLSKNTGDPECSQHRPLWDKTLNPKWQQQNLQQYLRESRMHMLQHMNILSDLDDALKDISSISEFMSDVSSKGQSNLSEAQEVQIDFGMGDKKSHEVHVMAHVCSRLAAENGIKHVADIGSGRGYLGAHLSLAYGLKTLGIDSSTINTDSANSRTSQLSKLWPHLVKKAQEKTDEATPQTSPHRRKHRKCHRKKKTTTCSPSKETDNTLMSQNAEQVGECRSDEESTGKKPAVKSKTTSYMPVTQFITKMTDIGSMLQEHFDDFVPTTSSVDSLTEHTSRATIDKENVDESTSTECSATHAQAAKHNETDACSNHERSRVMLTGLHTCGDLAASILRIYAASNDVDVLCSVGCCYHLICEEFLCSSFESPDVVPSEPAFPLSSLLRKRKCQLGRNARMLACQSIDKMAFKYEPLNESLYWRALLQVILRDLTGETREDWRVGRIATKCNSLEAYVLKALKKLKIEHELTREDIESYEDRYGKYALRMRAFFTMKAVLAPVIETLIMLDRYAFVLEQKCTHSAHLVRLFDPVKSPRCYAIIATKLKT